MDNGLLYSSEELTADAIAIRACTTTFETQIQELLDTAKSIGNNYQSEDATDILKSITLVSEDSGDFKEAIYEFANAIDNEIVPAYQKIEAKASATAQSVYGNKG